MRKDTKRRIAQATEICRQVVNRWDPYDMIANGAPQSEFESEIASIVRQINRIQSRNDAVHVVSRVFSSSFNRETFDLNACALVGADLHNQLLHAGLLDPE